MANYAIQVTPDGNGNFNRPSVTRGATALVGGTAISLNTQDAASKNSLHEAFPVVLRAFKNSAAANGNPASNFTALLRDNNDGTYTVTSAKYDVTSITSGTAVTRPSELITSGLNLQVAMRRGERVIMNDKAANG
jgi:hypothetical protein